MEIADGDPEWAIGFLDECWWSRVALPTLSAFSEEGEPPRMIQQSVAKDDPEPKAISCYGLYLPRLGDMWLRFVDDRPVSSITTQFLSWCCEELEGLGKIDPSSDLGQRELAHLQGGSQVAGQTQSRSQEERLWGEDRQLPAPETKSVAERYRAQVGSRQTEGRGVRWAARCV